VGALVRLVATAKRISDTGGGRGHLLKPCSRRSPIVSGVLSELPHVIAEAKGKLPDRIELVAGDCSGTSWGAVTQTELQELPSGSVQLSTRLIYSDPRGRRLRLFVVERLLRANGAARPVCHAQCLIFQLTRSIDLTISMKTLC
jgi:hypothetical protein